MPDGIATTARDRITRLVADILAQNDIELARNEIRRDVPPQALLADIGVTSVDMVNLMLAVEAEFDLTIPAPDITPENFRSVSAIAALVGRL